MKNLPVSAGILIALTFGACNGATHKTGGATRDSGATHGNSGPADTSVAAHSSQAAGAAPSDTSRIGKPAAAPVVDSGTKK
ncbi:hypothetical protein [Mucilaginibacter sp. L3T2-6]|uniref:hypothetical protein n=1 Tax=Mucilaginibacter sp. L3T2-6 TaxID=3062491 RepID=UPI0026764D10|nr:hypothetical protein [Mucilaginibacter sp. L3T2-6]MDO3641797.1 hypothetical protein [Mucilaginibacter sp. L3T2-6]MDV6214525.1 hypothetical protein [Mucilaginibacter sp. L3T2-6]